MSLGPTALHPGAAGVLRDALTSASHHTQVIVTSHSPDLLDDKSISDASILAVLHKHGQTIIGPVDPASRSVIREKLFTAGELLRLSQLNPDVAEVEATPESQLDLFGRKTP